MSELALIDIEGFVQKHGSRNCARIMSMLGKKQPFVEAMQSEVGQQILKEAVTRLEILLEKGFENTATDDEKAEYRVLKKIVENWSSQIATYNKGVKRLKQK